MQNLSRGRETGGCPAQPHILIIVLNSNRIMLSVTEIHKAYPVRDG